MSAQDADYERMAWHLMTRFDMTAEAAVETIRLLLSDDPVDTAVLEDGIGVVLNGLLNDGSGCGPVGSKAPADPHPTTGSG